MNSLLDKNTKSNLRVRDLSESVSLLESAISRLVESVCWASKGNFEDSYSACEEAEAECKVALDHLRELVP